MKTETITIKDELTVSVQEMINAATSTIKSAKGKLANGVRWSYDHATGKLSLGWGFTKKTLMTVVDGIKKGYEWIRDAVVDLFNRWF